MKERKYWYSGNKKQKIKLNAPAKLSVLVIILLVLIAIFAPVISNDKPLYISYKGHHYFPAISGETFADILDYQSGVTERINFSDWSKYNNAKIIMPIIPYAPHKSDLLNADYKSPFDTQYTIDEFGNEKSISGFNRHLLGTGKRGEDVLSGLIYGTRVSLTVGLFSMIIAGTIGIFLGSIAGYFGDEKIKITRASVIMLLVGILPAWFYAFQLRHHIIANALSESAFLFCLQLFFSLVLFAAVLFIFNLLGTLLKLSIWLRTQVYFPLDSFISRVIEIIISLPRLILIIAIAAIARPSLFNLILIIGITSWTEIARLTRAEFLRIRSIEYVQSARSMGFKEWRIIFYHALPNAIAPAMVSISFGIASAILVESGLSFLGIGVPQDVVTWGSLLASGKENFSAWWLVVFPGLAVFITVTAYNLIGEGLRDAMDPKNRK